MDDLSSGRTENLCFVVNHPRFRFTKGSILDSGLENQLRGVEIVFHLAAIPRVRYSIDHPEATHLVNAFGTLRVLEAAQKAGVKRVILASSSSVYGQQETMPISESASLSPVSPYGVQKLMSEHYARLFSSIYGMETLIFRFFNVYGPRQDPHHPYAGLIPKALYNFYSGKAISVNGDGLQTRDFTYVDDIVSAMTRCLQVTDPEVFGRPINLGAGEAVSVNRIIGLITAGNHQLLKHGPPLHEARHTQADIRLANKYLGWKPAISVEEGLGKTIYWFKKNSLT